MRRVLAATPASAPAPEIALLLWMLDDARARTRAALEGFPVGELARVWVEGGHSVGTLLYHLAAIEWDWLASDVLEGRVDKSIWTHFPCDVRDSRGHLTVIQGESWTQHWARLDLIRGLLVQTFTTMTLDDFRRPRVLPDYEVTPEWVLHHLCQHEAEHRTELRAAAERAQRTGT